jgi:poly(A) polymerase
MSAFPTSECIYNRLKTDSTFLESKGVVVYHDTRSGKYIDVPIAKWVPVKKGGDVPWHRVYYFKYDDVVIWDRQQKICTIDEISKDEIIKMDDQFKICTFNIMNDSFDKKITDMSKRKNDIIKYISKLDADIVCLQEVDVNNIGEDLEKLPYNIAKTSIGNNDIYILSKPTIIKFDTIKLGPSKEILWVDVLTVSNTPIRIYGVHLTSDQSSNAQIKRVAQLQMINKLLDYSTNFIILGDFNHDSYILPHILASDAWIHINNDTNGYTFNPETNKYAKLLTSSKKRRLDRILFSGFLEPENIKMDDVELSDHYPVISQISVKTNKPIAKTSTNSLCAIIPYKYWNIINTIRKKYDPAYKSWMPHINILFPFVGDSEKLSKILEPLLPIEINIIGYDLFEHCSSYTLYGKLDDDSIKKLQKIHMLICKELSISPSEKYIPHLTLGKFKTKEEIPKMPPLNLEINLDNVHLISKEQCPYYTVDDIIGMRVNGLETVTSIFGEEFKVKVGGSFIFGERNSDYDLLVTGSLTREKFFDKFVKIFQTCGYFTNVKYITNEHVEYIKLPNFDIHYCQNGKTDDMKSLESLSIVTASQTILDIMNNSKLFLENLNKIRALAKENKIYGNQYGYLPGLAWAMLVAYFMKTVKFEQESFVKEFCKFYANFDYSKCISLTEAKAGDLDKQNKHMKIICPVKPHNNIARTMTLSTLMRTLECFSTEFKPKFGVETQIIVKTNSKNKIDTFITWFNTFYTKLILQLEKLKIYVIPSDKFYINKIGDTYVGTFTIWHTDKLKTQTNIWSRLVEKTYKIFDDLEIDIQ